MVAAVAPLAVGLSVTGTFRLVLLAAGAAVLLLSGIPAARGGTQLDARGVRPFGRLFAIVPWETVRAVHPTGLSTRRGQLGLQLHDGRIRALPSSRIEDLGVVRDWLAQHLSRQQ